MKVLTVEKLKSYSRTEANCDPEIFEMVCNAAEEIVQDVVGKSFYDMLTEYGAIPKTITEACYIVAAHILEPMVYEEFIMYIVLPNVIGPLVEPYAKSGICSRIFSIDLASFLNNKLAQLKK